jgi:1-acyl-sn-glycerol-3-phosphate acyltransferase
MEGDRFILRSITDEIMYELMKLSGQEYADVYAASVKERLTAAAVKERLEALAARGREVLHTEKEAAAATPQAEVAAGAGEQPVDDDPAASAEGSADPGPGDDVGRS